MLVIHAVSCSARLLLREDNSKLCLHVFWGVLLSVSVLHGKGSVQSLCRGSYVKDRHFCVTFYLQRGQKTLMDILYIVSPTWFLLIKYPSFSFCFARTPSLPGAREMGHDEGQRGGIHLLPDCHAERLHVNRYLPTPILHLFTFLKEPWQHWTTSLTNTGLRHSSKTETKYTSFWVFYI